MVTYISLSERQKLPYTVGVYFFKVRKGDTELTTYVGVSHNLNQRISYHLKLKRTIEEYPDYEIVIGYIETIDYDLEKVAMRYLQPKYNFWPRNGITGRKYLDTHDAQKIKIHFGVEVEHKT